jgi:tellurite resistance protein TerC
MYFLLADLMHRFIYLKIGLALLLVWVGIKMLLLEVFYISTPVSLAVIFLILATSIGASLWATRGQPRHPVTPPAAGGFRMASDEELAEIDEPRLSRSRTRVR